MRAFAFLLGFLLSAFYVNPALAENRHFPTGTQDIYIAKTPNIRADLLANISTTVENAIANGDYPGAVVLVAHRGQIVYRGVFGNRQLTPAPVPMQLDTIFDVASLTKVLATTPAIMQLVEQGKLDLDLPVAHYWPGFAANGKSSVTVRELLTHSSGFPPSLAPFISSGSLAQRQSDALQRVEQTKLIHTPGTHVIYSDINFISLGILVEKISGERIDQYAQNHIFKPLGMNTATFMPPASWQSRIAPTTPRWGQVNDPTAFAMGGVAGFAGVFADAQDIGLYLQCLLDGGRIANSANYLLGPLTIAKMTTPQTPAGLSNIRGLGWDMDSEYSNRGVLLPINSYGHTGWTGTSVWVDPATQTWIIILTSRTYPSALDKNPLLIQRRLIADIVAGSITDINTTAVSNTGKGELSRAYSNADQ